jgi:hypothetical protein
MPENLNNFYKNVYSQRGEDGIIEDICKLKVKPGRHKATSRHHLIEEWSEDMTHAIYSEINLIK